MPREEKKPHLRNPKGKYAIEIGWTKYRSDIADRHVHLEVWIRDWMQRHRGKPASILPK